MNEPDKLSGKAGDHLANERTYLAWVRTSIGIMAFGFVVVRFSLFVKQISLALGRQAVVQQKGNPAIIGVLLVAVGAIVLLLSFFSTGVPGRQYRTVATGRRRCPDSC